MRDLLLGLLITAVWTALQFVLQVESGWIHLMLIAGVILIIRGIVLKDESRTSG